MNHQRSNMPIPNPTRDIASTWVQLPEDARFLTDYDDGDPIRNKYAVVGSPNSPKGLSDPLDISK